MATLTGLREADSGLVEAVDPAGHKCPECGWSVIPRDYTAPPIRERWEEANGIRCPKCDTVSPTAEWMLIRLTDVYENVHAEDGPGTAVPGADQ